MRIQVCNAPSGLNKLSCMLPRALPWAVLRWPFGPKNKVWVSQRLKGHFLISKVV